MVDIFRRRPDNMRSYADSVLSLSREHGLSHWTAFGRIIDGWSVTTCGDTDRGIELLRAGVAAWQKAGARLWLPLFLTLEAEACAKAGRSDDTLELINCAISASQRSGERWYLAEMLRIKARVLSQADHTSDQVETLLAKSLEIARSQQARCWELRAACDLALLWRSNSRVKEALELLQPIYTKFTEGFGTADLQHARQILGSLKPNESRKGPKPNKPASKPSRS
jgi:predicted ATPase